jgi:membrane protein YqaA with SNARE-associated domain
MFVWALLQINHRHKPSTSDVVCACSPTLLTVRSEAAAAGVAALKTKRVARAAAAERRTVTLAGA